MVEVRMNAEDDVGLERTDDLTKTATAQDAPGVAMQVRSLEKREV